MRFQGVQRVPHKKNPKKPTSRHIIKMPKVKVRRDSQKQQDKYNLL